MESIRRSRFSTTCEARSGISPRVRRSWIWISAPGARRKACDGRRSPRSGKARISEEVGTIEAAFQAEKEAIESRYNNRKSVIARASKSSRKQRIEQIEGRAGKFTYEIQKEMLKAERSRADTQVVMDGLKNQLAQERETLSLLEAQALRRFRGYKRFRLLLSVPAGENFELNQLPPGVNQLLEELAEALGGIKESLNRFRGLPVPFFFSYVPLRLFLLIALISQVATIFLSRRLGIGYAPSFAIAGCCFLVVMSATLAVYAYGRKKAEPAALEIARSLEMARMLFGICSEQVESWLEKEIEKIDGDFKEKSGTLDNAWKQVVEKGAETRDQWIKNIDDKESRITRKCEELHRLDLERFEKKHAVEIKRMSREAEALDNELEAASKDRMAKIEEDYQTRWGELEAEWKKRIQPMFDAINAGNANAEEDFPEWSQTFCEKWSPPGEFKSAAKFARLEVDLVRLADNAVPKDKRLAFPGPTPFSLPLSLAYPRQGSILFETSTAGREDVLRILNNIILRLFSAAPPGRLNFTIIDPVGLGQSFAGLMHLADYEENLINSRIWTQSGQIEQRLADLNEHMEKVIQMYLRNVYETIAEYNEQAGNIAEKYHFLVVADFPVNFTDAAAKRLLKIAASGTKCGVYTLIHWDRRHALPQDFVPDELRKSSVCVIRKGTEFAMAGKPLNGAKLILDPPPPPELATEFTHKVGQTSRDSNRVEVPFSHVAPHDADLWSADTAAELRVPIGRTGATKLQFLAIGKGTRQHALIAGKTGSGKSTLFHVIITNLSLWCSPEQVEFYLVDFKKGVEFKCYAAKRLPHAKVVAIESDREFGLSVLQRIDDELKRRGDLFRKLGAQDIAGYKRAGGTEPIPRSLLIIDEFQEFFVEDDKIAQTASVLLDRIVRQGRAFGIHALLGSQTLGGAYTLARTTLGQMVIRIALQCNEADAYLIMDDNNPAPRLLSRPGEGIYNDAAGALEGNSPFQAVWLSDEERDVQLDKIRMLADRTPAAHPDPFVFEGNAPADIKENNALRALLEADSIKPAASVRLWLGAPNSIKGPTEVIFHKQSGNNLIFVGQSDEAVLAIMSIALVTLAAQHPLDKIRLILIDGNPPDSPPREHLDRIVRAIPHRVEMVKSGGLSELLGSIADDLKKRTDDEQASEVPSTFILIHGIHKLNKLRQEDEFSLSLDDKGSASPASRLNYIICEGAKLGVHLIVSCDTYNNMNRFLGRKALNEFEMRVLFQMSANDSASLIESPKASALGLNRALFCNSQEGQLETFRPYALPDAEWIERTAEKLKRLAPR